MLSSAASSSTFLWRSSSPMLRSSDSRRRNSVMLVLMFGQTRVFYQMARDGLIWKVFSVVNPRFQTPAFAIAFTSIVADSLVVLPCRSSSERTLYLVRSSGAA